MASYAQKVLSRPNDELLLPVYINDQATAATTTFTTTTTNIIRGMLAVFLITIMIFLSSPNIILSIVHPKTPTVQLDWLSISSLNASDTQFSGQWEANITATNTDKRFIVVLEAAKITVSYKGFNNSSLSGFSTKNVTLNRNNAVTINAMGGIGEDVMVEARESGQTSFQVEMTVVAIQMAYTLWDNRIGMRFSCGGVPVDFVSGGGEKTWFSRGRSCTILQTQQ